MAFEIPEQFFLKLFDLTGDGVKNKGFMLFYFDSDGDYRKVIAPMKDQIVLSALRKKTETFLDDWNNSESMQMEIGEIQ